MNLGVHNVEQLRQNVNTVKNSSPLTPHEGEEVERVGPKLAAKWGPHFGPATKQEEEKAKEKAES